MTDVNTPTLNPTPSPVATVATVLPRNVRGKLPISQKPGSTLRVVEVADLNLDLEHLIGRYAVASDGHRIAFVAVADTVAVGTYPVDDTPDVPVPPPPNWRSLTLTTDQCAIHVRLSDKAGFIKHLDQVIGERRVTYRRNCAQWRARLRLARANLLDAERAAKATKTTKTTSVYAARKAEDEVRKSEPVLDLGVKLLIDPAVGLRVDSHHAPAVIDQVGRTTPQVTLNAQYLRQALAATGGARTAVSLSWLDGTSPVYVRAHGFFSLIMPIHA